MLSEPTLDDVLADRQKHMLCSDVDPAIRRRKEITKKFGRKKNTKQNTAKCSWKLFVVLI